MGSLETRDLYLQIVFPTSRIAIQTAFKTGPHSRNYFLLSLRVPDDPAKAFAVPTITLSDGQVIYHYDAVGKRLTDLTAAWFGKRFDYHGDVVSNSILHMPDLSSISPSTYFELGPYNHKLRSDLGIKLNLEELRPVLSLLYKRQPERELAAFWAATRFYARALRAYETDPEVAFFHFVVSLEIIASQIEVPSEDLYDQQIQNDLKAIEEKLDAKVAARIRNRLLSTTAESCLRRQAPRERCFLRGKPGKAVLQADSRQARKLREGGFMISEVATHTAVHSSGYGWNIKLEVQQQKYR